MNTQFDTKVEGLTDAETLELYAIWKTYQTSRVFRSYISGTTMLFTQALVENRIYELVSDMLEVAEKWAKRD